MPLASLERKMRRCKICHRLRPDVSVRGKCWACVKKRIYASAVQLHNKEGPDYEKWKAAVKKSAARL